MRQAPPVKSFIACTGMGSEAHEIKGRPTTIPLIMTLRRLEGNEAVDLILHVLGEAGKPLTTREVQAETVKRLVRCPDSTVVFLNRLRIKGLIKGERSRERKGWIWWVEG